LGLAVEFAFSRFVDFVGDDVEKFAVGPAGFDELVDAVDFAPEKALVAEHAVLDGLLERAQIDCFFSDRFGEALVHWKGF